MEFYERNSYNCDVLFPKNLYRIGFTYQKRGRKVRNSGKNKSDIKKQGA